MKCQNCGKNEVSFYYSSNINGNVTEKHLCGECAAKMGYELEPSFIADDIFSGFFPELITSSLFPRSRNIGIPVMFTRAPRMGILLEDRVRPTAAPEAPPCDAKVDTDMKKRREINILREQMHKAADCEDFEKAAELRNRIREMEA